MTIRGRDAEMAYKTNAADQVFHFIQERIASGEWKPGDKIWTEMQLAEYLGISPGGSPARD